jgi:hypothetical protein
MQSAYCNEPTPLQKASYGGYLLDIVSNRDGKALDSLLSYGISQNPSTEYGDSLVHLLCRRGDARLLDIVLDSNKRSYCRRSPLQVANYMGRTPLHETCCAPRTSFVIVDKILKDDPRLLFMADIHGNLPLDYVCKEQWAESIEYINAKMDEYWPQRDIVRDGPQSPPPLTLKKYNTRYFQNPKNALTSEIASMVASGEMKPEEAHNLVETETDSSTSDEDFEDSHSPLDDADIAAFLKEFYKGNDFCLNNSDLPDMIREMQLSRKPEQVK